MLKKILCIVLLTIFAFSVATEAQKKHKKPRHDWDEFDDIAWMDIGRDATPLLELNYGLTTPKQKKFNGDFSEIGMAQFRIGYSTSYEYYEDYLVERKDNFLFANFISSDLNSEEPKVNEFETEMWQFGIGKLEGIGYDLSGIQIIPYTQSGILWNRLTKKNIPGEPVTQDTLLLNSYLNDINILDRYDKALRFGTTNEVGLKVNIASFLDISGGYQFTTVMPRYLVWKHLGSYGIEIAGLALLDQFIEEIVDSSPAAGPLMSALLKGAYSFAFYQLKKDNMNWPFATEAPLSMESFKFGLTFVF